jgi:hypothetical protein
MVLSCKNRKLIDLLSVDIVVININMLLDCHREYDLNAELSRKAVPKCIYLYCSLIFR